MNGGQNSRYLTPAEYAAMFRVSPTTVRRMCEAGRIEGAVKLGRQWRIPNPERAEAAR